MSIIAKLRQQGKSISQTWADLKRRHLIDYDPMDKLMNEVVAYYCIVKPRYAKDHTHGHTHIKIDSHRLNSDSLYEMGVEVMEYIHFAEVVWAECKDGTRFCYKSRQIPKDNMAISDEDFFMIKLQAVSV